MSVINIPTIFNNNFTITQFFGQNIVDYTRFGMKGHNGVDFIPWAGESWNVGSVMDGAVIETGFDEGGFGNFVKIKSGDKIWLYAHLDKICINRHQFVKTGQNIGIMGNTGNSTGPHLHLGLKIVDNLGNVLNNNNGYFGAVDPLPFLIENKAETLPEKTEPQIPDRKFENVDYQNAWNGKNYAWFAGSLLDRDGEVQRLKAEVETWKNQNINLSQTVQELTKENLDLKNQSKNENNQTVEKIVNQSQNVSQIQIMKEVDKEATFGFIKNHAPTIIGFLSVFGYNMTQDQILQSASIAAPFIALTASWFMEKMYKLNSKK